MSESDAQMAECAKRKQENRAQGKQADCSKLLSACLSKLPGCLRMEGMKQFPQPCLINFLHVLNKRIQTPKLQQKEVVLWTES